MVRPGLVQFFDNSPVLIAAPIETLGRCLFYNQRWIFHFLSVWRDDDDDDCLIFRLMQPLTVTDIGIPTIFLFILVKVCLGYLKLFYASHNYQLSQQFIGIDNVILPTQWFHHKQDHPGFDGISSRLMSWSQEEKKEKKSDNSIDVVVLAASALLNGDSLRCRANREMQVGGAHSENSSNLSLDNAWNLETVS